jgi:Zinc carboxypeptidase
MIRTNASHFYSLFCFFALFSCQLNSQPLARKTYTSTPVYDSIIAVYQSLSDESPYCELQSIGQTDIGKPLHLFIISADSIFYSAVAKKNGKAIVFINNGIHPGEPDGIDACIELAQNYVRNPTFIPKNTIICIVPVYNVDGCLNRGSFSRANQDGPEEYGFRGNAKNLDLNRDFVKTDAWNTRSLIKAFQDWKPDVFIDTHVSDGADYQHVMTLIATQRSKLHPVLSDYMDKNMLPALYASMKKKNYDLCPYVETRGRTPESGIEGFLETPRFSTGYTALFNCIGFVTETHMLKPYNQRVWATYDLLLSFIEKISADASKIVALHAEADKQVSAQKKFALQWELDTTQFEMIEFHGYEAAYKKSEITGLMRLYYDRNKPYTKQIKYYNTYKPTNEITAPDFYIIPQAYRAVIDRLSLSGVKSRQLKHDTLIEVEVIYITDYQTVSRPYEAHYLHSGVKVRREKQKIQYYEGDYLIPMKQAANRYIVETLEPESGDSFFAWNLFDGCLQQKEWFSDYVFEDKVDSILLLNPQIRKDLQAKQKSDTAFANDHWAQMNFIYQRSGYKEITHNRYPVSHGWRRKEN